ncbi:hypothetical protein ACJX0J_029993, partial [Zea mays]
SNIYNTARVRDRFINTINICPEAQAQTHMHIEEEEQRPCSFHHAYSRYIISIEL